MSTVALLECGFLDLNVLYGGIVFQLFSSDWSYHDKSIGCDHCYLV